jgi:hypothetical protein
LNENWIRYARDTGLELESLDGGMKLCIPGCYKRDLVKTKRNKMSDVLLVYLGDDEPDGDAFRVPSDADFRVLVRPELINYATGRRLKPLGELPALLQHWAQTRGDRHACT